MTMLFSPLVLSSVSQIIYLILLTLNEVVNCKQFEGIPGLYCGLNNCYDVLGATPESSKDEIAKLYRAMAKKWHPDRFKTKEEKELATEKFRLIASAYETLRDPGTKYDYDDMMENPEDYYQHYYRYYKRAYGAKVDARVALAVLITLISAYQYWIQESRYNDAIDFVMTIPRYRNQALDLATKRGLWPPSQVAPGLSLDNLKENSHCFNGNHLTTQLLDKVTNLLGKQNWFTTKAAQVGEVKKEKQKQKKVRPTRKILRSLEEQTIRDIIISENTVTTEGYASVPDYKSILWLQLLLCPWSLLCYLVWLLRWYWKFTIMGQSYGLEEQIYLLRKNMKSLQDYCKQQEECSLAPAYLTSSLPNIDDRSDLNWMLKNKLWSEEKFSIWRQKKEDEIKAALSQNACFKRYKRYMRKGGPGQITFLDD